MNKAVVIVAGVAVAVEIATGYKHKTEDVHCENHVPPIYEVRSFAAATTNAALPPSTLSNASMLWAKTDG